jgi:hypothetical protein
MCDREVELFVDSTCCCTCHALCLASYDRGCGCHVARRAASFAWDRRDEAPPGDGCYETRSETAPR